MFSKTESYHCYCDKCKALIAVVQTLPKNAYHARIGGTTLSFELCDHCHREAVPVVTAFTKFYETCSNNRLEHDTTRPMETTK